MVDKEHSAIFLGIGIGALVLALLFIPISQSAPSHATDVSNDQPPLFISTGGTNSSTNNNANEPCTFMIFRDISSNQTFSKNCSTGKIDFKSSDSYTVIQESINAPIMTTNNGGLVFIKAGNYTLSHEIDLNRTNTGIVGEGYGSIHQGSKYYGVTRLAQADNANILRIIYDFCGGCNTPGNHLLANFEIDANPSKNTASTIGILDSGNFDDTFRDLQILGTRNTGVYMQDCHACTMDNIFSESGNQAFVWFGAINPSVMSGGRFVNLYADNFDNSTSFTIQGNVKGNLFANDIAQDDKGRCFYMFYSSFSPSTNTFTGNECYQLSGTSGLYGFDLSGAQGNTFTGNIVYNMGQSASNTYDGFFLHTSTVSSINNTFTGNIIASTGVTNHMRYGFNENDANQDFNVYIANNIAGMATAPIRTQGVHSKAIFNIGYNPVASSTVTAGASVWTYTNNDGYTEQMILSTLGGQTAETCHGINSILPTTIGTECTLDIGQSLTATWATTAPVYTKVPLD